MIIKYKILTKIIKNIFLKYGVSDSDSNLLSKNLVETEMMGFTSHGIQRVEQYINDIKIGKIQLGKKIKITKKTPTTSILHGGWNFGQVTAIHGVNIVSKMAENYGTGCIIIRGATHVGRVGSFTEMLAKSGFIGIAMTSAGKPGHWVAPFGGREGRLCTSPIAFAAPTNGDPISMDFSTSSMPEGNIRYLKNVGQMLPDKYIIDENGNPSSNPSDLYNSQGLPAGAILPFGGLQGYKSFGLGIMAHVLSALLGNSIWEKDGIEGETNGLWLLAIKIESFMGEKIFTDEMDKLIAYIRSSKLNKDSSGIIMPGEKEFTNFRNCKLKGINIEKKIWNQILSL